MAHESSSRLGQLAKDTLIYGVASVAQKFIGLFLFPIYARLLTRGEFGIQDLLANTLAIVSSLAILGMDSGTARDYYDSADPAYKKTLLSTWLIAQTSISLAVTFTLIALSSWICHLLYGDRSISGNFSIAFASLPFMQIVTVGYLTLRMNFRSKAMAALGVTGVLLQAGFGVLFVVVLRMGVKGVFLGQLAANGMKAILVLIVTVKYYAPSFSWERLKKILIFGLPFVPASASLWLINYANRFFVLGDGGFEAVGLLSAAARVASTVGLAVTAFRTAWGPFAFSISNQTELSSQTYARALTYYALITSGAAAVLSAFSRELLLLLATRQYRDAFVLVPYLCLSPVLWGATYIVGMGYQIARRTYHVTVMTIIGAGTTIAFNLALIGPLGAEGSVIATLASNLVSLVYSYVAGRRYLVLNLGLRRLGPLLAGLLVVLVGSRLADSRFGDWSALLLGSKVALVVCFCILSVLLYRNEWKTVVTAAAARLLRRSSARRSAENERGAGGAAPGSSHDE